MTVALTILGLLRSLVPAHLEPVANFGKHMYLAQRNRHIHVNDVSSGGGEVKQARKPSESIERRFVSQRGLSSLRHERSVVQEMN